MKATTTEMIKSLTNDLYLRNYLYSIVFYPSYTIHIHIYNVHSLYKLVYFKFSILLAVLSTVFISRSSTLTAFYVTILLARMSLCFFIRFDVFPSIILLILSCFPSC